MNQKSKRANETIERIFAAAMELFGEKGYTGATMDEIIARAGISKGAVYWHFKSKRDLFIELFVRWMEEFAESYQHIYESDAPPQDKIKTLIEISGTYLEEHPEQANVYLEFLNLAIKDHGFFERMMIIFDDYKAQVKAVIDAGIESGVFNTIDSERAAELLITSLDGMLLRACVDPKYNLKRALQFLTEFVFRALGYTGEEEN